MVNSISPFLRSPFTDITGGMVSHQLLGRCARQEMGMMDCLEAYGLDRGRKMCQDYIRDFDECQKTLLQFKRFVILLDQCMDSFWDPDKSPSRHRPGLKLFCRWNKTVWVEVAPSDRYQLVVLTPQPSNDDAMLNYVLIVPSKAPSMEKISIEPRTNYTVFATFLHKDGRPTAWHGGYHAPSWEETTLPERRAYTVQFQILNNTVPLKDTHTGPEYNHTTTVTGLFSWNQTGDADVCFEFDSSCSEVRGNFYKRIGPNMPPQAEIIGLLQNKTCEAHVSGLYGSTTFQYHTYPADLAENSTLYAKNISLHAQEDGLTWQVHVTWSRPLQNPERYNVTLLADDVTNIVVPWNSTGTILKDVRGEEGALYNVSIGAVYKHDTYYTSRRAPFPVRTTWVWASVGGAWGAAAVGVLAAALCYLRLRNRSYQHEKPTSSECKPLDDSSLESLEAENCCGDGWEVRGERLLLHEVLGEGAFGVVRRGTLAPHGKEVAVKMLKDFPSKDEVDSFRREMELMKSVGAHPHVVSLVGCCSGKRLLIIAEYCSRGDLLSFLRCSWDVMVSKRNAKYYNNNIDTSDYKNDQFKRELQRESSRLVVNKLYDLQGVCDTELTSLDLLSFCRQIAMGMEFLASNRLVHRDLAARNILVTGDRTLKIADFGLSRDVYQENHYQQTGNGKMPVKWMALESLTRRIYTSQSDVWSFGVVVWEVVTVGGSPYPEVPAARLPRLLRAGYRMPRPINCSKQLYELMLSCWRAAARERPTFAELHRRLDAILDSASADDYLSLEMDDAPPPTPRPQRYFRMIIRAKRSWTRGESYERPLKAPQSNHYTSPPATLTKTPV